MNDLEKMIAKLNRPSPSPEIDERIGKVVMEAEWGRTLTKKILKGSPLLLLVVATWFVSAMLQTKTTSSIVNDSVIGNASLEPSMEVPELNALMVPIQMPGRIWGTDKLTFQVKS